MESKGHVKQEIDIGLVVIRDILLLVGVVQRRTGVERLRSLMMSQTTSIVYRILVHVPLHPLAVFQLPFPSLLDMYKYPNRVKSL